MVSLQSPHTCWLIYLNTKLFFAASSLSAQISATKLRDVLQTRMLCVLRGSSLELFPNGEGGYLVLLLSALLGH